RADPAVFDADDHAILERLLAAVREVDHCFRECEFSAAAQALYGFFWNDFCDWYVEVSKAKLKEERARATCLALQDQVLEGEACRPRSLLLQLGLRDLDVPVAEVVPEEAVERLGRGAELAFPEAVVDLAHGGQQALEYGVVVRVEHRGIGPGEDGLQRGVVPARPAHLAEPARVPELVAEVPAS